MPRLTIAGLSLLGDPRLQSVDPVFCLPKFTVERLGLGRAAAHYAQQPRAESPSLAEMTLESSQLDG